MNKTPPGFGGLGEHSLAAVTMFLIDELDRGFPGWEREEERIIADKLIPATTGESAPIMCMAALFLLSAQLDRCIVKKARVEP